MRECVCQVRFEIKSQKYDFLIASSSQGVSASGPPQPAQAGYPADANAIISVDINPSQFANLSAPILQIHLAPPIKLLLHLDLCL